MSRPLFFLLLIAFAAPLYAETVIKPFSAEYDVHYNGFKVGILSQSLEARDDGTYLMETVAQVTGVVAWFAKDRASERSIWRYHNGRIRPLSYRYHYTGRSKDRVETLDFDWDAMKVDALYKGERKELPLSPNVYDRQLYQLVLRNEVASGAKQFHYSVAERGELRDYDFKLAGREQVVTPYGKVDALKMTKGDTELWLDESNDYLVAKIEKDDDGEHVVSYITGKSP